MSLSDLPSGGPLPPLGICAARHPMQVVTTSVHWIKPDKLSGEMWGDAGSPRKPRVTCVQDHRQLIPLFLSNCQVRVSEMPSTQLVLHLPPQTLPSTPSSRAQWALRDLDGALPDLNASARCHVEWQKE